MPKISKHSQSGWSDRHFISFWQHYAKVQEWVRIENKCRQNALEDWGWGQAENQCISLLSVAAAHLGTEINAVKNGTTFDGLTNGPPAGDGGDQQTMPVSTTAAAADAAVNELDTAIYTQQWTSNKRKKRGKQQQQQNHHQKYHPPSRRVMDWDDNNEMDNDSSSQRDLMETEETDTNDQQPLWGNDDQSTMDEQMRAFRQTTLEHRKQWAQKKREQQQKQKAKQCDKNDEDSEEYFDASQLGVKALSMNSSNSATGVTAGGGGDGTHKASPTVANDLATRAREYRRQNLYGPHGVAKLDALEAQLCAHFEAEFAKHTPDTWPNIPLRF